MRGKRVREFLDQRGVHYEEHPHRPAVSAQQVAAVAHESGWHVAKPVLLKVGDELAMALVPAPVDVDLDKARTALNREDVVLASESEFSPLFDDCDIGAEPIFGNVYGLPVYIDPTLKNDPYLVFRDGTHARTLKVATRDFLRTVEPRECDLADLSPFAP